MIRVTTMGVSMQYGLISLILVQLGIAAACFYAYLRQRNQSDLDKHDKVSFSARLEAAYGMADSARKGVEMIEVTHYKALFAKYEVAVQEIASLKAGMKAMEESIASLSNKLASRERQDRIAEKKATKPLPDAPADPEPSDVDSLVRNGMAFPLSHNHAEPAAPPSTFGKKAR